jgi:limonene-1,2-epoxide hydrolase
MPGPRTPTKIVEGFCAAWGNAEWNRFPEFIADDVEFHMVPLEPAHGAEALTEECKKLEQLGAVRVKILAIGAAGNVVFTERIDSLELPDRVGDLPVMGIFEIADDRIIAWRDYFDMQQALEAFGLTEVM